MNNKQKVKAILQNIKKPHIHFIGIGGKGLNGLAMYCLKKGMVVSGSDTSSGKEISNIIEAGGVVFDAHDSSNISVGVDVIVHSSIIREDNPEILSANDLNIPVLKRSELLGLIMDQHNVKVSVAGSHGKSTTTALCGLALLGNGGNPTIFDGAYIKELDAYEHVGEGRYVVAEACEYDKSFMDLISDITIITAIEKSHMEYYKTEEQMIDAFKDFISSHSSDAVIIANGDNNKILDCLSCAKATVETFGFNENNSYIIKNVRYSNNGSYFDIYYYDTCIARNIFILIPGDYNVYNFVATVVMMHVLDLDLGSIYNIGKTFQGVGRRFEVSSVSNDLIFIDDFCHHPTQVKNLFFGIHQLFPDKKVCAVFQPRQFHLMKTFLKEYGEAFSGADSVIVTDIVPALGDTEFDKKSLRSSDIIDSIKKYSNKNEVSYMSNFTDIVSSIRKSMNKDWVVATIGAGDIYKIKDMYVHG